MTDIVRTGAVGAYVPMVDGPEKVSGRAKYTADFIAPQMLTGRIYRSPYAHAEIIDVDTSQAAKVPGVVAIITGADCANTFGVLPIARTEHPLARDKVRYKGEPVAAVAAVDAATADKPIWYRRPPTIAPRCARTRWKCTRPSPSTIRCASA
jgi:4-hydroxybenzoyl-CoA reductase subunit alpha